MAINEIGYPATPGLQYAAKRVMAAIEAGDHRATIEAEMQRRVQGFEVLRSVLAEIIDGCATSTNAEIKEIARAALLATELH